MLDGPGEQDLDRLLGSLAPWRHPGSYVFVTATDAPPAIAVATVVEPEGRTLVVERAVADAAGWAYDYVAGWITLGAQSALAAIGLTAVITTALAEAGISANVIAGHHHDHLFVPVERADEAVELLRRLGR